MIGLTGCSEKAFDPGEASTGQLTLEECKVDRSPEVIVVSLDWFGGLNFYTAQYRLFGDGRLIREIVPQTYRDRPLRVDEVQLAAAEMDLMIRRLADRHIVGMTPRRLWEPIKGKDLGGSTIDAGTAVLQVEYSWCDFRTGPVSPYSIAVSLTAPDYQLERRRGNRQLEAVVELILSLDPYFPVPVWDALDEALDSQSTRVD